MKLLFALTLSLALPLSAQEEAKKSPAERLLEVTEFKKTIIDGGDAGFALVEKQLETANLTKKEMAEVKTAFIDYMTRLANDPELTAKTIELYNKNFTPDELEELIAFYQTPLGRKTLVTLPEIMGESMKMSTKLAQKHVGPFQKTVQDLLMRKQKEEEKE
ncbi:MAG: DUF2059 domain-containing protein [Akkermansiaceae bacterium]|jgi:hypothetical protein